MGSKDFINYCKKIVADYFNNNVDKTDHAIITENSVYVVWSCKTLQNNKALLSTTVSDGMYYEVTYDGDNKRFYLDTYKKWQNRVITYAEAKELS